MTPQRAAESIGPERSRKHNPEATLEMLEFERKVTEYRLTEVLTGDALMLAFLLLGSRMWKES